MKDKRFEIELINSTSEMNAEKACAIKDICTYIDFAGCPNEDICGVDYSSGS